MDILDEPVRAEVERKARPGLLHLMRNHCSGQGEPRALLEVVDVYLRLNPKDAEVREARERLLGVEEESRYTMPRVISP
jgi:hypothetical protein